MAPCRKCQFVEQDFHFLMILELYNSASEMTYIVSGGALNSTHSLPELYNAATISNIVHFLVFETSFCLHT